MESGSELLGVRIIGPAATLKEVEQAASGAGWTDFQKDQPGSLLLLAPKPYHFEQFTKLIDALDRIPNRDFSLQLIGPDGKAGNFGPSDSGK
jgi:hypothetical protein